MFLPSLPTLCSNFAIVRLYLISIKSAIHWMLLSHNLVSFKCIPNSISVFIRLWQFLGSVYVIWILIWTGLNFLILLTSLRVCGWWGQTFCFKSVSYVFCACFCAYLFVVSCAHLFVNFWLGQDWISWDSSALTFSAILLNCNVKFKFIRWHEHLLKSRFEHLLKSSLFQRFSAACLC